jgi:hypothetical protein
MNMEVSSEDEEDVDPSEKVEAIAAAKRQAKLINDAKKKQRIVTAGA